MMCKLETVFMFLVLVFLPQFRTSGYISILITDIHTGQVASDDENCLLGEHACQTLQYALEMSSNSKFDTDITVNGTLHNISGIFNFTQIDSVILSSPKSASITCFSSKGSGNGTAILYFRDLKRIQISNLTFHQCHYSLYPAVVFDKQLKNYRVGLQVEFVNNVSIDQVRITKSSGSGLRLYNIKQAIITSCHFRGNGRYSDIAGGITVHGSTSYKKNLKYFNDSLPKWLNITHTQFINNVAMNNHTNGYKVHKKQHYLRGRGAGLQVSLTNETNNYAITIQDCQFLDNKAVYAGGLHFYFQHKVSENTVLVKNCNFSDNSGVTYEPEEESRESGGGAFQIMLSAFPFNKLQLMHNNTFIIEDCLFQDNSAYWGGAVSIVAAAEHNVQSSNSIRFINCSWRENRARLGSAVDAVYWTRQTGPLACVTFENCSFVGNTAVYSRSLDFPIEGAGTIYSDLVPINFTGTNNFEENNGSGITAVDCILNFENDSNTNFIANEGIKGGGISLYGKARIVLYKSSTLRFKNNSAFLLGGGIYYRISGPRNLVTSQDCFIQYFDPTIHPTNWSVSVIFDCNVAKMDGHDIYASSLFPCIWNGGRFGHGFSINAYNEVKNVFKTSGFTYNNCSCWQNEALSSISTDCLKVNKIDLNPTIKVQPGKNIHLNENSITNELGHPAPSVFRSDSSNTKIGKVLSSQRYIFGMNFSVSGKPGNNFSLKLSSPWTLSLIINLDVSLLPCAPGFIFPNKGTKSSSSNTCSCSVGSGSNNTYVGIVECDKDSYKAKMRRTYWAGYLKGVDGGVPSLCTDEEIEEGDCKLYTGRCRPGICTQISTETLLELPDTANNTQLADRTCDPSLNRSGILCGKCKDGYGLSIISQLSKCVKCTHNSVGEEIGAWTIWVITRLAPLTVMLIIFLLFDIDVLTRSLQSFIFFAQMLPILFPYLELEGSTNQPKTVTTLLKLSYSSYSMWRLVFFSYIIDFIPHVCDKSLNALDKLLLDYIPAFYPFIFIGVIWLAKWVQDRGYCWSPCNRAAHGIHKAIHRLKRSWSPNSTIIHGIAAFIVFSYTRFLQISLYLITYTHLFGQGGQRSAKVTYFDGNIPYASRDHLPYLITAVVIIVTFVSIPPLILILVPILPRALLHYQPDRSSYIIKVCDRLFSGPKWQCFLDAFQGGFKDKCTFFAGLFFVYRIALLSAFSFNTSLELQYFTQAVLVVFFLVVHAIFQPYRRNLYNIIDTLIYGNMLVILLLASLMWYQSSTNTQISKVLYWLTLTLINSPQMCFLGYIVYKTAKVIRRGVRIWRHRRSRNALRKQSLRATSEEREEELMHNSFVCRGEYVSADCSSDVPENNSM